MTMTMMMTTMMMMMNSDFSLTHRQNLVKCLDATDFSFIFLIFLYLFTFFFSLSLLCHIFSRFSGPLSSSIDFFSFFLSFSAEFRVSVRAVRGRRTCFFGCVV